MNLDDPKRPEFSSCRSYENFAKNVRRKRRYVWDPEVRAFLDTLLATVGGRDITLEEGTTFYRAQQGVNYEEHKDRLEIFAYNSARMKPLHDRAREGRANPAGIPVLYLATSLQTAISEVRPWIGSEVSVAKFKICRNLNVINLSVGDGDSELKRRIWAQLHSEKARTSPKFKEQTVWLHVDHAFSRPISVSDDTADYVPTQILAELFYANGYDALIYRSQFGEKGFNLALFDIKDAEVISVAPYEVTAVEVKSKQIGNTWFSVNRDKTVKTNSE